MRRFDYARADSLAAAVTSIAPAHRPLAGGTDLLPLLKHDLVALDRLVDIKHADLPRGIETHAEGVRIGALTTLTEIEHSALLAERYPLLVQAAGAAATRQIRNRATLGGNLLQRPRCAYFRDPDAHCWLEGGEDCLAVDGDSARHAVFGGGPCHAVHPSDLAACLVAIDASVTLKSPCGERRLAVSELFALPEPARRTETTIRADELLLAIDLPAGAGWRSVYLKTMERKAWAFALVGLALAARFSGSRIIDARVVFSGVAPIPWRHTACEAGLRDASLSAAAGLDAAVEALAENAAPLPQNGYKLDLARRLLRRAVAATRGEPPATRSI